MMLNGKLTIGWPRVEPASNGKTRLIAAVTSPEYGKAKDLWIEVDEEYGEYLCHERSDAFLVGMMRYALGEGYDIECAAPVSEELLYNLRTYLIPALSKASDAIYAVKIEAAIVMDPLPNKGAVGAGMSCGIDSLHVLIHHTTSEYTSMNLTHLVLNNVGAYREGTDQFKWQLEHARQFADEYGFKLIGVDSNYIDAFPANHKGLRWTHTYANAFCTLALQKLWRTFYYGSSGYDFTGFTVEKVEKGDSALYDLLSLNVFSTRWLRFYSEGAAKTRFEKTRDVATYPPARKYLHVCTHDDGPCCNTCEKCCRTIMTLDALGRLDDFRSIFDVDYYRHNRKWYLNWMYYNWYFFGKESLLEEVYAHFKGEVTFGIKFKMRVIAFRKKIFPYVPQWLRDFRGLLRGKGHNAARKELFGSLPKR